MRPKVLMFGWEFPPHKSGGLGTACLGLTRALSHEDVDVTFVLPKRVGIDANHAKFLFADDDKVRTKVKVRHIDSMLQPYITSDGYLRELDRQTEKTIYGSTLIEEVLRYGLDARHIAETEEFDVIHAHDWLSFAAGVQAKKASGKPLILHFHATEYDRSGGQGANPEVYAIEQEAIAHADKIVAVSSMTKQILSEKYGVDPNKVEVIHNGIEKEAKDDTAITLEQYKAKGYKIVLYLGRITIQKGPDYFIHAARKVIDHYKGKVLFVVAGSGDMHKQMIELAAMYGISDKVIFTGWLQGEESMKMFRTADLYIMPSVSEPFGLTPLEAALEGTPSLISKQSGVSEIMQDVLKTDFWDVDEMANQIVVTLQYDSLRQTLQKNSGHEAFNFNWQKPAQKCVDLYNRLIKSGASSRGATA